MEWDLSQIIIGAFIGVAFTIIGQLAYHRIIQYFKYKIDFEVKFIMCYKVKDRIALHNIIVNKCKRIINSEIPIIYALWNKNPNVRFELKHLSSNENNKPMIVGNTNHDFRYGYEYKNQIEQSENYSCDDFNRALIEIRIEGKKEPHIQEVEILQSKPPYPGKYI